MTEPAKRRGTRREEILRAAVHLFNERGYHETAMNDIGEAVGITGPGIYRHFKNKEAILETALVEAGERIREQMDEILEGSGPAEETLDLLVERHVQAILELPAFSVTVLAERRVLGEETRAWISRQLRLYVEEWVNVLVNVRPEISDGEARALVHASLGLTHAVDRFRSDMPAERLAALFKSMILATLHAEKPEVVPVTELAT